MKILKPSLILLAICMIASLCLGVVNELTKEPINKMRQEEESAAQKRLFPDATDFEIIDTDKDVKKIVEVKNSSETIGYIINIGSMGFDGEIEIAVAFDLDNKVHGVEILSQTETPGLGAKIVDPAFKDQYLGSGGPFEVTKAAKKNETEIEAITSATISSRAVTDGINAAIEVYESLK